MNFVTLSPSCFDSAQHDIAQHDITWLRTGSVEEGTMNFVTLSGVEG
jgi:hypothetical protein